MEFTVPILEPALDHEHCALARAFVDQMSHAVVANHFAFEG
jgi:hypothetical protein